MNRGILYGVGAYLIWGMFPLYWKALQNVPALQILGHRIVWSFILLVSLVVLLKEWPAVQGILNNRRSLGFLIAAACLLGVNWLIYIWGVNAGFVVETSLGYFINPLVNVLLGVLFLRERLRPLQWIPIGLAALGVLYMTISVGSLPWIALALAFSFGLYGLLKKMARLTALPGLTVETAVLLLPSIGYLLFINNQGSGAFGHTGLATALLLAGSGFVTAVPLLLFNAAARTTNLSTLGLLQYMAPTIQLLLGVLVYREPFNVNQLVGFGLIWTALLLYSIEGLSSRKKLQHEAVH